MRILWDEFTRQLIKNYTCDTNEYIHHRWICNMKSCFLLNFKIRPQATFDTTISDEALLYSIWAATGQYCIKGLVSHLNFHKLLMAHKASYIRSIIASGLVSVNSFWWRVGGLIIASHVKGKVFSAPKAYALSGWLRNTSKYGPTRPYIWLSKTQIAINNAIFLGLVHAIHLLV